MSQCTPTQQNNKGKKIFFKYILTIQVFHCDISIHRDNILDQIHLHCYYFLPLPFYVILICFIILFTNMYIIYFDHIHSPINLSFHPPYSWFPS
jgi:hypothetical protein